jgi:hypothetical protein
MRDRWSRILGLRGYLLTRLSTANGNRGPEAKIKVAVAKKEEEGGWFHWVGLDFPLSLRKIGTILARQIRYVKEEYFFEAALPFLKLSCII